MAFRTREENTKRGSAVHTYTSIMFRALSPGPLCLGRRARFHHHAEREGEQIAFRHRRTALNVQWQKQANKERHRDRRNAHGPRYFLIGQMGENVW
jgi:hypothetical protein